MTVTVPAAGLWVDPDDACCDGHPNLDSDCPPPTIDELAALATQLLSSLFDHAYPGYITATDELVVRPLHRTAVRINARPHRPGLTIGDPRWPVVSVASVTVDGTALASTKWRLDIDNRLVRLDDESWPCGVPIVIAYTQGAIPAGGAEAAKRLLCALRKAAHPTDECQLPAGTQIASISYSGLSMQLSPEQIELGVFAYDPIVLAFCKRAMTDPKPAHAGAVIRIDPRVERRTLRQAGV